MPEFTKRAPFVTVEGVDGAGKSSHIDAIVATLQGAGWTVISTREPGGTPLGEDLRNLLLNRPMSLDTEILLAFASRAQHLTDVIRPALEQGVAVVCDRFTDSTCAYQGGGRHGPIAMIQDLERTIHADLQPDLTLLFDLPVEMSLQRLAGTGKAPDKFESQNAQFFQDVRNAYHQRVAQTPDRFAVIDSSVPKDEVAQAVARVMATFAQTHPAFELDRDAPTARRTRHP